MICCPDDVTVTPGSFQTGPYDGQASISEERDDLDVMVDTRRKRMIYLVIDGSSARDDPTFQVTGTRGILLLYWNTLPFHGNHNVIRFNVASGPLGNWVPAIYSFRDPAASPCLPATRPVPPPLPVSAHPTP